MNHDIASHLKILVLSFCIFMAVPAAGRAENWPGWRGPRGDGSSIEHQVPVAWDGTTGFNLAWRVKVPGIGHSSPIVWDDQVFLTTCNTETHERQLLCFDCTTGGLIWSRTVFRGPLESVHALNSRASGTPVTDGESIFVAFMQTDGRTVPAPNVGTTRDITAGQMLVASYDRNGGQQWVAQPGDFVSAHGFCSCPVLYEDLVIINGDHDGNSYIVALDKRTGELRWRRRRTHGIRSYVTPLIREAAGRTQMVFSGSKRIVSLDPTDGAAHWTIEGPTEQMVASMVFDGEQFYMTCGYPDHFVMGLRADGQGDVTDTAIQWESRQARSYVPSPVVIDRYLIVADDRGTANCFDTRTGKRHWQARMGRGFRASIIQANGLAYLTANDGETIVIEPGESLDVVARNPLGDDVSASAAVSRGYIYLRGHESLYRIGPKSND